MNSGYDEKFRAEILNLGLEGFDKIVKLMESDQCSDPRDFSLAYQKDEEEPPLCITDPLPRVGDPGKFVTEELICKVHPADQRPLTATAS